MSVSPRQNFLKPPPVPETPTVTFTPRWAFWNSSATASVIGYTVDEPSICTILSAARIGPVVPSVPATRAATPRPASVRLRFMDTSEVKR